MGNGDSSSSSSHKIMEPEQSQIMSPRQHHHKAAVRLADGVERSRSPQSAYSAKLAASKQQNKSVYYYSDTLKRTPAATEDSKVNTRVTLDDHKKKAGSTLV